LPAIKEAASDFDFKIIDIYEFYSRKEAHEIHALKGRDFFTRKGEYRSLLELNEKFYNRVTSIGCDVLVLGTIDNYAWYLLPDTVEKFQKNGILVVGILGDDEFTSERNSLYVSLFDKVIVYVRKFVDYYNELKPGSCFYLPNSCFFPEQDFSRLQYAESDKKNDVILMGSPFGGRPDLVRALVKAGVSVALYGSPKWKQHLDLKSHYFGYLPAEDIGPTIRASKIVLGSLENHLTGVPHMNTKIWDAVKYGQFCISTYYPPLIEDYGLVEGEEIVMYTSTDDLVDKVKFYLDHPAERKRVAGNLFNRVRQNFDYVDMYRELFIKLGEDYQNEKNTQQPSVTPKVTVIDLSKENRTYSSFDQVNISPESGWAEKLTEQYEQLVRTPYVILTRGDFSYSTYINKLAHLFPQEFIDGKARLHLASEESLGRAKVLVDISTLVWEKEAFFEQYLRNKKHPRFFIQNLPYSFGNLRLCTRVKDSKLYKLASFFDKCEYRLKQISGGNRHLIKRQ
jgi:spore maturation protein CgeB